MKKKEIRKVVQKLIGSKRAFSAYNVTQLCRATGEKLKHSKVRNVVVDMFNDGQMENYTRDIFDFDGNQAWVYYPDSIDLDDYQVSVTTTSNH